MKIAILGWGSLIWQPKELAFDKEFKWKEDGPTLPIEYARISKDGRLTLVITPEGTEVRTLYALSTYKTVEEAVLNLAVREGSGRKSIGYYDKTSDDFMSEKFQFKTKIREWIHKTDFDAVIWTNLGEKWEVENLLIPSNERCDYLRNLKGNKKFLAEEYIRKTPTQIKTKYRTIFEKELNWTPII
jgi:hypothetical protein